MRSVPAELWPWGNVVMNGIAADEVALPALPLVSNGYQVVDSAPRPEVPYRSLDLVASGVRPMIEVFPKERVADAYERAASGSVRSGGRHLLKRNRSPGYHVGHA